MAQLIAFSLIAIFGVAVFFYGHYMFRRLGGKAVTDTASWPRGKRLVFFCLALALTVIVIIPAAIVAVGYAFGMTDCSADLSPTDLWRCSLAGRSSFLVCGIAIGIPLAALWVRLLLGMFPRNSNP